MSLPRPATRLGIVLAALAGLLALGLGSASAHVTVSSPDASAGGFGKVVFRVPNESDTASTVRIRIQLPTDTPFTSVRTQPVPGWAATLTRTALDPPVSDGHGGEVTEAVSVVEFAAQAGNPGIGPNQFQEFALSLGRFPDADSLSFSVVQTYSDGTEAAWIEPTVEGQAEPEHPAPLLTLSAAADGGSTPAADGAGSDEESDGPGAVTWIALAVGGLGLLVGSYGVVLARSARRRTVAP